VNLTFISGIKKKWVRFIKNRLARFDSLICIIN